MGLLSRIRSKKNNGDKKQASQAALSRDDSSDISLMTDSDLEEDRAALRAALDKSPSSRKELAAAAAAESLGQASLWAEVDREELERIAIGIARNALPQAASGEGAEAAARLNASAAAAEKAEVHDLADPLGYGRIDIRTLTLDRDDGAAARQPARYSAASSALLDAARRGAAGRGRGAPAGDAPPEAPPALRARVLPGSESFDAELYLGTIHADTTLPDLQRGLAALRVQLGEHTGQLKALVKENFDRFISSKNTIDAVHAQLARGEAEGEAGVHGASTGEVLQAVLQVQGAAQRAFGPLLERAGKAERIRSVLGVMRRYEAIVQLPSRVRQHAEAGDYEQVVADYRKAKALLGDHGSSPRPGGGVPPGGGAPPGQAPAPAPAAAGGGGMWVQLLEQIDKVVASVVHSLEAAVRDGASSPAEAAEAARHILQLRAVGVPMAQRVDPVGLYVEAQERQMRAALEAALQQHTRQVEAARRQQQASADAEAQVAPPAGPGPSPAASPAASAATSAAATPRGGGGGQAAAAAAMEAATVRYIARITSRLCQWLPDYWSVTQQRLPALAAIGDAAAAVERGLAAAERGVAALLAQYRSAVQMVLSSPAACGLTHTGLLSIASELASGCQALQAPPAASGGSGASGGGGAAPAAAPPAAVDCLQRLVELAVLASLASLGAHLAAAVAALCAAEDFHPTAASRRAGAPATASVAALQELVQQGMQHLGAALAEAARGGADPLRKSAAPARALFLGCFTAYARGADALAAGTQQPGGGGGHQQSPAAEAAAAAAAPRRGRDAPPPSAPRRLLVLAANLGAVRGGLLPAQFSRWAAVLQAGGGGQELQAEAAAVAAELEAAETRLAGAYLDCKQAVLDEAMEQLLFGDGTAWEAAPPPLAPRPAALELVHAVAAIRAELAAVAPSLAHEALEELLLGTVDGFAQARAGGPAPAPGAVLSQGTPAASPGGVLQLWLEASLLLAAMAGLVAASEVLGQAAGRLQATADARLEAAVAAAAGEEAARLAAWAGGGGAQAAACRRRLEALCEEARAAARCNLAPLQQQGAPGR